MSEAGSAVCDVLQQSDNDGVLPEERRSLQPAVSSSTLGSSLDDSEADQHASIEEEEEEELGSTKDSVERLICSEEEEEVGRLSPQRLHQTEDSELEDIVLEDEQVDDFASSVLAAISCWHYRVQAFLSTTGTVRLSAASLDFFMVVACRPPFVTH